MESSGRRIRSGAWWGRAGLGQSKGGARGSEMWICLYCFFLRPLTTGWTRIPQAPRGLFSQEQESGLQIEGAFGACANLSPKENTLAAPHTPCCKARTDPLHLRLEKTEPVAWHHLALTFQLSPLWGAGRDLLVSSTEARLAAGSGGTWLRISGLEQSARSRHAQTSVS